MQDAIAIPSKGFTHGGKFHADDVFSTALLLILNPEYTYERGMTPPKDFDGIVYDIGLGVFDHHQADRRVRENGIPYAAFGLLWEAFGARLLPSMWKGFDKDFIQPLDLSDNTGVPNALADAIDYFNPAWDVSAPVNSGFPEAVELAKQVLERAIKRYESMERAKEHVEEALRQAQDHILILPTHMPWKNFITADIDFVVYPSTRGGYNAQAIDLDIEAGTHRCEFPSEWYGHSDAELVAISGRPGLRFCHKSGFLLAGDDLETILNVCKEAVAAKYGTNASH